MSTPQRPDWVPPEGGAAFATSIQPGVTAAAAEPARPPATSARRQRSVDDYVAGLQAGDRTILAQAITLIESNAPAHAAQAQALVHAVLPLAGGALRVGITGVPGAGKSTFIEALGLRLCDAGHRVAVLAVDPSSTLTRGSILADKTRMEHLGRHPHAYIRPSPSGGTLGGVARKSRETMLLCEAAGFDVLLVETVGVGQSETTVRGMVDVFLLLLLAGAGDEVQGIKRGIMELADVLLLHKADGDNRLKAFAAMAETNRALHYLAPATEGWTPRAYIASSRTGEGLAEIWHLLQAFEQQTKASGVWAQRRLAQQRAWMDALVEEHLRTRFQHHPAVQALRPQVEAALTSGTLSPTAAAQRLIAAFEAERGG